MAKGPSTQSLRSLVPNTIKSMVFETRNLKCWVLGPSGLVVEPNTPSRRTLDSPSVQPSIRSQVDIFLYHILGFFSFGCFHKLRVLRIGEPYNLGSILEPLIWANSHLSPCVSKRPRCILRSTAQQRDPQLEGLRGEHGGHRQEAAGHQWREGLP